MSILAVGCSYTRGQELSNPAEHAWPSLIGKYYNRPVKNLGTNGASNEKIFRNVVEETAQQEFDLVLVQWSEPSRLELFNSLTNKTLDVNIGTFYSKQHNLNWLENYYKLFYDDKHAHKKWLAQIIALQGYLQSKNQPYLMLSLNGLDQVKCENQWMGLRPMIKKVNTEYYLGWPYEGITMWRGDTEVGPGGHPLEQGHKNIAEQINEYIRNLGWLS